MSQGARAILQSAIVGVLTLPLVLGAIRAQGASDIYVSTTSGGGSVLDYNGTLSGTNGSLTGLGTVEDLAVGLSGSVYVGTDTLVNGNPGLITAYNSHLTTSQGNTATTTNSLFLIPGMLAVDPASGDLSIGRNITTPAIGYSVCVVDQTLSTFITNNGGFGSQINLLAASPLGGHTVIAWSLSGGVVASFGTQQTTFDGYSGDYTGALGAISGLAYGPDGNFYAAYQNQVTHFDGTVAVGNPLTSGSVGTAAAGPIAVSALTGNVYVPQTSGGVAEFSTDLSTQLAFFNVPGTVSAIKVDPVTGNVIVGTSNNGGQVLMYDAGLTTLLHSSASGLGTVANIDFSPANATLPGDLNGDHVVNTVDYGILTSHWFQTGITNGTASGDMNGDGTVNLVDFAIFKQDYINFNGGGGSGLAAVPEPSTFVLVALAVPGGYYFLKRRKKSAT